MSRILFIVAFIGLAVSASAQPGRIYKSLEEVKDPAQVYHLQLHGKKLKQLPAEVYQMTNLLVLDLRNNKIAMLPDSVSVLSSLKRLDLSRNPLLEIPKTVGQMSGLEELVLWSTYVTQLPEELAQLDETLRVIDFRSCPMTPVDQELIDQLLPSVKKLWNYACNCGE